ncbi:MAG: hypothetical protein K8R31_15540 [Bacteroidales bacterium]|nr:hypothetical protein [Bacteroidales bacterium]
MYKAAKLYGISKSVLLFSYRSSYTIIALL